MGSPPDEAERRPGEDQVEVTLTSGFWAGKYEVTQGDWKRVVGKLPGELTAELPEGDDYPVGNVNFAEAEAFCRRLTELARNSGELPEGWEFRLPTEAQWEYACRAGTTTATAFGDKLSSKQANFKGKPYNGGEPGPSLGKAARVGSYPPNAWGLHDMHGNTFEWCRDWYHAKLPGGVDPDLHDARLDGDSGTATGTPRASAVAARGPTTAGPAARPSGCGSSRSGATTTSASGSSPCGRETDPAIAAGSKDRLMAGLRSAERAGLPLSCCSVRYRGGHVLRMCSSLSCRASTVPGAPVMRSVPLAVLGKAMQSRMLVSPA